MGRDITKLLQAYRNYLLRRVGKVRILGEANERELKEVFVELRLARQRANKQQDGFLGVADSVIWRRIDPIAGTGKDVSPKPLLQRRDDPIRHVMPDELLRRGTKAIVAGAPGCGKTTLLKYLALKAQEKEQRLVVWLELKAIDKSLFAQAERAGARGGHLVLQEIWLRHLKVQLSLSDAEIKLLRRHWEEKYQANEIIALLDGFDELQDRAIERSVNKCVSQFINAPHDNPILISTRPYAQHELGNEQLQELEIQPLNHDQVAAFLNCYYPNDATITNLLKALRDRTSLRELLNVPLLLGVVLRLYKEGRFTGGRLTLYETVVHELIYELDRSKFVRRHFRVADESLHLDFLKFLAFERLLADSLGEAPETNPFVFSKDLLKVKARQFLARENLSQGQTHDLVADVIQTPLLREISKNTYAFTHTTLHEYLAACHFAALCERRGNEWEGANILCRALHNPTIVEMEVLPMMLGRLKNADRMFEALEQLPESFTFANLRLRARGLGYGAAVSQEHLTAVIELLVQVILGTKVESKPYFEAIGRSFAAAPDPYLDTIATSLEQLLPQCGDFLRINITDALGYIGGRKAISVLRALLQDKLCLVRQKAAYWLGELGDEASAPALTSVLGDTETQVVANAANALVKIGTEEAATAIIDAVHSENEKVRATAIFWLGILCGENVLDLIEEILDGDTRDVRLRAVEALGYVGGKRALAILRRLYQGTDFGIRTTSVRAAGQCGGEQAVEFLLTALQDPVGEVRMCAIDALAKIDGKRFVDVFIDGLRDPHPFVRQRSATALNIIADRKAIPALLTALEDKSQSDIASSHKGLVLGAVAHALRHFKDEQVVQALIRLLREDKGNEGAANAAIALGMIGDKRAVEPLLDKLREPPGVLRARVAEGLGLIRDKRATLPLIAALQDGDDFARMYTVEALGIIRDERAIEALLGALQYPGTAGEEAALAFRFFEGTVFAEELSKALSHQNPFVRRKAVSYVGYYSLDPSLLEPISHLAETDEDRFVRRAAAEAKEKYFRKLEYLDCLAEDNTQAANDNESKEGVSFGEVQSIVSAAGHIFRRIPPPDWGLDAEIEFKNDNGEASGLRVYLQLKSGDSHLYKRKHDGKEIFRLKNARHAEYWSTQRDPVLLVIRNSSGSIRWMDVSEYLKQHGKNIRHIEFQGESLTAESVKGMPSRFFGELVSRRN